MKIRLPTILLWWATKCHVDRVLGWQQQPGGSDRGRHQFIPGWSLERKTPACYETPPGMPRCTRALPTQLWADDSRASSSLSLHHGCDNAEADLHTPMTTGATHGSSNNNNNKSRIVWIRAHNLAGMVVRDNHFNNNATAAITVPLGPSWTAVTGESGTSKSLLITRTLNFLSGGKPTASLRGPPESRSATVEVQLELHEPHASFCQTRCSELGIPWSSSNSSSSSAPPLTTLTFRRTLSLSSSTASGRRWQSTCHVNGHTVTLKAMTQLLRPLICVVDATVAEQCLAKPGARLAVLDQQVPPDVWQHERACRGVYQRNVRERQRLELELAALPAVVQNSNGSDDDDDDDSSVELLQHWIDELDAFQARVDQLCQEIALEPSDHADSLLAHARQNLSGTDWLSSSRSAAATTSLLSKWNDLRNALKVMDQQVISIRAALDAIAALASTQSAVTALETARRHLYDVTRVEPEHHGRTSPLALGTEHVHELLNTAESLLHECAGYIADDERGLLAVADTMRRACPVSLATVDELVSDWQVLARKHGVMAWQLPATHVALRHECDGTTAARAQLPAARTAEAAAQVAWQAAHQLLMEQRQQVASKLAVAVNARLPSLGMESSRIDIVVQAQDAIISLWHDDANMLTDHAAVPPPRGGAIQAVASSGEKARILLALEAVAPGSLGILTTGGSLILENGNSSRTLSPAAIFYDEIDAHVGGRAAVAVANLLAQQARHAQVVTITHNPSVAATADTHVVMQLQKQDKGGTGVVSDTIAQKSTTIVRVVTVTAAERRKELGRMASGDLAAAEAEVFAEALIRDGQRWRKQ